MKHIIILLLFLLSTVVQGQKIIEVAEDLKVILAPDGTWKRLNSPLDSLKLISGFDRDSSRLATSQYDQLETLLEELETSLIKNAVKLHTVENTINTLRFRKRMSKDKEELKSIKNELKSEKKALKRSKKLQKKKLALRSKATKLYNKNEQSFGTAFKKLKNKIDKLNNKAVNKKIAVHSPKKQKTTIKSAEEGDCPWLYNDYDEVARGVRIQTPFYPSLVYTHPNMQSYYKDDQFMTGSISLSKVRKHYFLVLELTLKSLDARKSYGIIAQKEEMRIKTVNGDFVYATVLNNTEGIVEEYTGHVKYEIRTKIRKSDLKKLSKAYLDTIGIMWSSGYEEYPIYNIDVLHKPALCLLKQ